MQTLTYGRKKPDTGDIGDEVFDALENNMDLDDAHTHDGVTSPLVPSNNINKIKQNILAANWSLVGNGIYKQNVTIVGSKLFDNLHFVFRDTSNGSQYFLKFEKTSPTQFDVFINDNSKDITIYYV
jgi:hypothetical protein